MLLAPNEQVTLTYHTNYNGWTVEVGDNELETILEEQLSNLTFEYCDDDGEFTEGEDVLHNIIKTNYPMINYRLVLDQVSS